MCGLDDGVPTLLPIADLILKLSPEIARHGNFSISALYIIDCVEFPVSGTMNGHRTLSVLGTVNQIRLHYSLYIRYANLP